MAKKIKPVWKRLGDPGANARRELPALARHYFASGRALLGGKVTPRQLHPFRLETKRFRYTLELFQPVYGPSLDRKIAALREIQGYLGDINDCVTTAGLLKEMGVRKSPQTAALLSFLDAEAARITAAFSKYWKETFDAAARERQWCDYLTRYAGVKPKAVSR
mgnify:CR=1 FL=1